MSNKTSEDRDSFLSEVHVGVLAVEHEGSPPLAVPIWYSFEDGLVSIHTARSDMKTQLLLTSGRFTLCVQSEMPPYRYVSMEGSITAVEGVSPEERTGMVHRYFEPEMAKAYLLNTQVEASDDLAIRMRPERWRTFGFAKQIPNHA